MVHARIIDDLAERLGGQAELGRRFGKANSTICHWKDDGIPARHWPLLLEIARRARYPLTLEDIHKHSPLRSNGKPARVG